MSINDLEFLHGAAFLRLLKGTSYISISYLSYIHSSLYTIKSSNQESAILFKISKKNPPLHGHLASVHRKKKR